MDDRQPTRRELAAAMRRDAEGMRGLQGFLDQIKDLDDAAFAEATGGVDRAEAMELLDRLTRLLAETDRLTAELEQHPDADLPPSP
jgi:hypothetical protein